MTKKDILWHNCGICGKKEKCKEINCGFSITLGCHLECYAKRNKK